MSLLPNNSSAKIPASKAKHMPHLAKNRVPFTIIVTVILLLLAVVVIFWARGFKPNFRNGSIERTGLIVITSKPTGANVYLDDRLTSATNTNIAFLDPKTYSIRIEKDGYTPWKKDVEVRADLATEIEALLFPLAPTIKPLTTTGANSPTLSPDGGKIVYGVSGAKGGVFVMSMDTRPFPFRQDLRQIAQNGQGFDFSNATYIWSPDSKEVVAKFAASEGSNASNILLESDKSNQSLRDITGSLNAMLTSWQQEIDTQAQTQAIIVPSEVKEATQQALAPEDKQKEIQPQTEKTQDLINYHPTGLMFSPDEQKVLYKDKDGVYKIYDIKEKTQSTLPAMENLINISWFPDSAHLVVAQNSLISIIETDGSNKLTVFSGKFENGFVFAHPSGSTLIILTTLTQQEGTPPNLYSIDLR